MNAQGGIIRFPDADLSPPMEQAPKLLAMLEAGADVAIGWRWMRQRTADYTPISGAAGAGLQSLQSAAAKPSQPELPRCTATIRNAASGRFVKTPRERVFSRQKIKRSNPGALTQKFHSLRSTLASKWSKCLWGMTLEPESTRWRMVCEWQRKRCRSVGLRCPGTTARAFEFLLLSPLVASPVPATLMWSDAGD